MQKKVMFTLPKSLAEISNGFYSIASLATFLEKKCGVYVHNPLHETLKQAIKKISPDILGISCYTSSYNEAIDVMIEAKRIHPLATRIVGGVHISSLPQSLHKVFDFGVISAGEKPLLALIKAQVDAENIPGLCYWKNGRIVVNPLEEIDFRDIPVPKIDKFFPEIKSNDICGLMTSRGCLYSCRFCYSKCLHSTLKVFPVSWAIDHIEYCVKKISCRHLMIWDDSFTTDIRRIGEMRRELLKRNIASFSLSINMRSSTASIKLFHELKALNVMSIYCGFESGSDRMLREIKGPDVSLASHKHLLDLAMQYGIRVDGSFIFGMPGETIEDMEMTLDFMRFLVEEKKNGGYKGGFWIFCATPLPGTKWWGMAGDKVGTDMDFSTLNFLNFNNPLLLDDSISKKEWERIISTAKQIVKESNNIF